MLVTFCFGLLAVRLIFLQALNANNLQIKAVNQWVRMLPLTATRGSICDCNHNKLAVSYTSYNVYIRAKDVKEPQRVAVYLSNMLNLNYEKVLQKATNKSVSESLLKMQVEKVVAEKIIQANLDGIYISEGISRFYPYNNIASQVLGFTTVDGIGQAGVEAYYNNVLRGEDGKFLTQADVKGLKLDNTLKYYVEASNGCDIKLSLDVNIQLIIEDVLQQINLEHNPKQCSIIVMDPNDCKILALGISPSINLNDLPRDNASELMAKIKNTTVTDVYEPGSTFKILTLAAAISENIVRPNEKFYCGGSRTIDGEKIKCWRTIGHGSQTLVEGVQNSCNCVFMDLAVRLGVEKLYKYLYAFGIGSKTGIDISAESSGLIMNKNDVRVVDLARIGFGHAVAVNQIQLLTAFCSAINGGIMYQPYIVDSISNNNQNNKTNNANKKSVVISSEVSSQINYLLEQALSKTGVQTFVEGVSVGGKTGTAQKYENGVIAQGKYVSSFFGFFPVEKPQYAVLICVDEPSSGIYYGSMVAKPYGKIIFEKIMNYKDIPFGKQNGNLNYVDMPNLVGLPLSKAIITLNNLNLDFEIDGEGGLVVGQFPSPATKVEQFDTVLIKTG